MSFFKHPLRKAICPIHGETEFYANRHCRACIVKRKQRIGRSRKDALEKNLTTYHGKVCSKCGGMVRYTRTYTCVHCLCKNERERQQQKRRGVEKMPSRRQEAILRGKATYSDVCETHGETPYNENKCLKCQYERTKFRRRWKEVLDYIRSLRERGVEPTPLLITRVFPHASIFIAGKLLAVKLKTKKPSKNTGE